MDNLEEPTVAENKNIFWTWNYFLSVLPSTDYFLVCGIFFPHNVFELS